LTKSEKLSADKVLIISILLISAFVCFLNETLLGVALPAIMQDLDITASVGQWLNTAYMLTMAVVIPITGYLQQRFSTRGLYIAAMSAFVLGTLLGAISPNFEILLLGRIVQASGAAVMFPLLMTTIMDLVPEQSRGRIMGNIGIVMSVAPALGPAVSGIILNSLEWRWLFIVMLPIGLVTSTIGAIKLRASHTPNKASIDLLSVAYSILAFGGLVYGLSSFAEAARGEAVVSPWLVVALGAGFMALFVARQIKLVKTERALLNLRTFKSGNFRSGIALMLISMLVMFGFMILLPIYMQDGLGMSAMTAGFVLLPGGLAMGLLSPVIGALYDKFGARKLLIPASFVVAALLWYMTTFNAETNFWQLIISYLLFMLAIGFFFTPVFSMTMGAVAPELYPHASATVGSLQQIGGAAGTAIFVTAFTLAIANDGGSVSAGTVDGTQQAFILGAIFWMATIVIALFIREDRKGDASGTANAAESAPDQAAQAIH
jgi:DHA2 family lincomycin resistance protein-like MFS transporter